MTDDRSDDDAGRGSVVRSTVAVIIALLVSLAFYFFLLGRIAITLVGSGDAVAIVLGLGVLLLPLIGLWIVWASLRAALDHQRLARRMHEEGREVDVSALPRRPSGRVERDAADALFDVIRREWEADPDNWRSSYRLARAYDYAGDRRRARDTMRRAVALEKLERGR